MLVLFFEIAEQRLSIFSRLEIDRPRLVISHIIDRADHRPQRLSNVGSAKQRLRSAPGCAVLHAPNRTQQAILGFRSSRHPSWRMLVAPVAQKPKRWPSSGWESGECRFNGLLVGLRRHAETPARNDGRRSTGRTRNASTPRILMQLAREN